MKRMRETRCGTPGWWSRGRATALLLTVMTGAVGLRPAHGAAASPVLQQMTAAVNAAHSYALSLDLRDSDQPGALHEDGIVVRQGTVTQTYLRIRQGTVTFALVSTGTRLCEGTNGHWSCGGDAAALSRFLHTSPAQMIATVNVHTHLRVSGHRLIHGQPAVGYSVTLTMPNLTERGVYWLDPSTMRPIEMDSSSRITIGTTTSTTTSTLVLSRWNDPSLVIPHIPGRG